MTSETVDLNDVLEALEPHGWRRAQSFQGLCRVVTSRDGAETGLDTIRPDGFTGRFIFLETWAGKSPALRQWPDRKEGTAVEVLAHVIWRYSEEARSREMGR